MAAIRRQEVRHVDQWAIDQIGLLGVVLMENAGRQATDLAQQLLDQAHGAAAAIVAGAGNNGGDGFVVARHLALRGYQPAVFLVAPRQKLSADAAVNLHILEKLNLMVHDVGPESIAALADHLTPADLVIDAVGGTGITGNLRGALAEAVRQINAARRPVLAIDIPTGLDCDTGQAGDPCVRATATVTFVDRKSGFDAPGSIEFTGPVTVADIGVPSQNRPE